MDRPVFWPHFSSPVRSTALTARLGRLLGIAVGICLVTGLLSHYQYGPWRWLPEPASPVWGFRLTQGVHVATGMAAIPLVLIKLWSVYPNLFRWPPVRSVKHAIERGTVGLLVAATLVQLTTGFANALNWYPFRWDFVPVHWALAWVVAGSALLHIGVKLPDIVYGLQTRVADGDVLSEIPWNENPVSHSNAGQVPPPPTPALSRRGVLTAAGLGLGAVVITTAGQTVKPLEPLGLLAIRQPHRGPQGVPVNRTAEQAGVLVTAVDPAWRLGVHGPRPYELSLTEVEALAEHQAWLPIACVEGWSALAHWRGVRLIDLVERAGGDTGSVVRVHSLEPAGFNSAEIFGPQLSAALLATHLDGARLNIDHGYPLRLIAPNRAGVLNTKWLSSMEVIS
jgi:hypothetical protein